METIIDKGFFNRNTQEAIDRYLSWKGFDIKLGYHIEPGPNKRLVRVVSNEPKKTKKVKKTEGALFRDAKAEAKKRLKKALKATVN